MLTLFDSRSEELQYTHTKLQQLTSIVKRWEAREEEMLEREQKAKESVQLFTQQQAELQQLKETYKQTTTQTNTLQTELSHQQTTHQQQLQTIQTLTVHLDTTKHHLSTVRQQYDELTEQLKQSLNTIDIQRTQTTEYEHTLSQLKKQYNTMLEQQQLLTTQLQTTEQTWTEKHSVLQQQYTQLQQEHQHTLTQQLTHTIHNPSTTLITELQHRLTVSSRMIATTKHQMKEVLEKQKQERKVFAVHRLVHLLNHNQRTRQQSTLLHWTTYIHFLSLSSSKQQFTRIEQYVGVLEKEKHMLIGVTDHKSTYMSHLLTPSLHTVTHTETLCRQATGLLLGVEKIVKYCTVQWKRQLLRCLLHWYTTTQHIQYKQRVHLLLKGQSDSSGSLFSPTRHGTATVQSQSQRTTIQALLSSPHLQPDRTVQTVQPVKPYVHTDLTTPMNTRSNMHTVPATAPVQSLHTPAPTVSSPLPVTPPHFYDTVQPTPVPQVQRQYQSSPLLSHTVPVHQSSPQQSLQPSVSQQYQSPVQPYGQSTPFNDQSPPQLYQSTSTKQTTVHHSSHHTSPSLQPTLSPLHQLTTTRLLQRGREHVQLYRDSREGSEKEWTADTTRTQSTISTPSSPLEDLNTSYTTLNTSLSPTTFQRQLERVQQHAVDALAVYDSGRTQQSWYDTEQRAHRTTTPVPVTTKTTVRQSQSHSTYRSSTPQPRRVTVPAQPVVRPVVRTARAAVTAAPVATVRTGSRRTKSITPTTVTQHFPLNNSTHTAHTVHIPTVSERRQASPHTRVTPVSAVMTNGRLSGKR